MFPIQKGCCGEAKWTAASAFSLLRFRCKLGYLAGRPMGNELLFRPQFLESPAGSMRLQQTAVGPRSSLQEIITRLTRTGHQIRTRWCSETHRGLKVVPSSAAIHMLDLKTRQVSTLSGSEGLYSPHWSPDGRYVLAMSLDSPKLMLFDFSTQKWAELISSLAAYPNWNHDGSYIYFINPYIAEPAVYSVRISDRKLELVTSLSRQRLGWSIAGKWMGLAGGDSPLILRDTGSEEIYALDWERP
jgi:WD40 repeat protein